DTGWIPFGNPLLNSFVQVFGQDLAYRRKNGLLHLQGEVSRATAPTTATLLLTFPEGFRPDGLRRTFVGPSLSTAAAIWTAVINPDGTFTIKCATNAQIFPIGAIAPFPVAL